MWHTRIALAGRRGCMGRSGPVQAGAPPSGCATAPSSARHTHRSVLPSWIWVRVFEQVPVEGARFHCLARIIT
jgi:hypothetical protein